MLKPFSCVDCKHSSRCFQKLIPEELEFISQKKTQLIYRKGEIICKQGAFANYVLYTVEGMVRLYLEGVAGRDINLRISSSFEFIGLSSLFGDISHNYSAMALTDSLICLIDIEGFRNLLQRNAFFASEVIRRHCETEKALFGKIKMLGNKHMHGRVAEVLLSLSAKEYEQGNVFSFLSRSDIAGFAGISMEGAVRILAELKNEGIIAMEGSAISILNPSLLKEISRRG